MRSDHLSKHSKTHLVKRNKKAATEAENEDIDIEDVEGEDIQDAKWQIPV